MASAIRGGSNVDEADSAPEPVAEPGPILRGAWPRRQDARAVSNTRVQRKGWRYRGNVAVRAVTACLGTYAIAALLASALARTLPMPKVEAVSVATLLAFLIAPAVPIWAFLAAGPWRALVGVAALSLLLYGIVWLAGPPA